MSFRLFCSDLDGTLLGGPCSPARFRAAWETIPPSVRPLLAYSSSRSLAGIAEAAEDLPVADYHIASAGAEIFDARTGQKSAAFSDFLRPGWDRLRAWSIVQGLPGVSPQPEAAQHEFKCSWFWEEASAGQLDDLAQRLAAGNVRGKVIYSSGRNLDIVPAAGGKGGALLWLCVRRGIPPSRVLVAGDSGNDIDMLQIPGVQSILVGNALAELRRAVPGSPTYKARAKEADGVIEGLRHYGILPSSA